MEELKQKLVDRLIEQIKNDALQGDTTVLDEILNNCHANLLINSLPEEEWGEFEILKESRYSKVETLKRGLEEEGYYCGNLWHVDDVKGKFNCTDEEAYNVLDGALQNEATYSQIWYAIGYHGNDDGLEQIEEE